MEHVTYLIVVCPGLIYSLIKVNMHYETLIYVESFSVIWGYASLNPDFFTGKPRWPHVNLNYVPENCPAPEKHFPYGNFTPYAPTLHLHPQRNLLFCCCGAVFAGLLIHKHLEVINGSSRALRDSWRCVAATFDKRRQSEINALGVKIVYAFENKIRIPVWRPYAQINWKLFRSVTVGSFLARSANCTRKRDLFAFVRVWPFTIWWNIKLTLSTTRGYSQFRGRKRSLTAE